MLISQGDATVFLTRPISAVLISSAFALTAMLFIPKLLNARKEVFQDASD
jgi:putative tricarboxylic transport membrane protein